MARRSDHTRDELRELILKTSSEIIKQEGYAGLTARKLAKEIGYTPGTIYNLFDSMPHLYLVINGQTLDLLYETLSSPACQDDSKTPAQNMKQMAGLYKDFAQEHHEHWLLLYNYRFPQDMELPSWYIEKIARLFEPLEALLRPFYSDRDSHKRQMAARILWSSVHGIFALEETGKISLVTDQNSLSDMTGYLIDNFIAGIEREAS